MAPSGVEVKRAKIYALLYAELQWSEDLRRARLRPHVISFCQVQVLSEDPDDDRQKEKKKVPTAKKKHIHGPSIVITAERHFDVRCLCIGWKRILRRKKQRWYYVLRIFIRWKFSFFFFFHIRSFFLLFSLFFFLPLGRMKLCDGGRKKVAANGCGAPIALLTNVPGHRTRVESAFAFQLDIGDNNASPDFLSAVPASAADAAVPDKWCCGCNLLQMQRDGKSPSARRQFSSTTTNPLLPPGIWWVSVRTTAKVDEILIVATVSLWTRDSPSSSSSSFPVRRLSAGHVGPIYIYIVDPLSSRLHKTLDKTWKKTKKKSL